MMGQLESTSLCRRKARFIRGHGFEKQRVEFILAHHSAKLPEGEERNEGAEDDERPAEQIVDVDLAPDSSKRIMVNDAFDELLDEVKGEDKQAEDDGLVENRLVQRFGVDTPAKVRPLSDENDLGDDKSIDDREGVVQIADLILFQEQHGVGQERAE